ncbi:MAG: Bax inhibitor-1/YccA family protein [Bacteroidales bacterium]
MALFRSSNPALSDKIFKQVHGNMVQSSSAMTIAGTIHKTLLLLLLAVLGASYTWLLFYNNAPSETATSLIVPYMWGGLIGGIIFSLIAIFNPRRSTWAAPLYAICEGLFLGAISAIFDFQTKGIAFQAVVLTLAVLFLMLSLYRMGVIKVTEKLRSGIIVATGGVAIFYLITWIIGMFTNISFLHDSSPISIGISLLIVGIAAFNFLLDFDFIEKGAQNGAPKYMEWFGAFGLMLTLVWLYLEMLRLLSKLQSKD